MINIYFHPEKHSTFEVDAKFISSNSVKVILKNLKLDNQCETMGFVSEITNENDHSNCILRIISNFDCPDLRKVSLINNVHHYNLLL